MGQLPSNISPVAAPTGIGAFDLAFADFAQFANSELNAAPRELLLSRTPAATVSNTTETTLASVTIVQQELGKEGTLLYVNSIGGFLANTNGKRVRAYLSAALIFDSGVISLSTALVWRLEVQVLAKTLTSQTVHATFYSNFASPLLTRTATTVNANIDVPIRVTGTNSVANPGDIFLDWMQTLCISAPQGG